MRARIKICCIQDERELAEAVAAGADCVGFVGRGLSGPEVIDDDARIGALAAACPPGVSPWLLTREADPDALVTQVRTARVPVVQLCDRVPAEAWVALRRACPGVRLVQVVHVAGPEALEEARAVAPHVDAVLLDSGAPADAAPVYGGTGRTHDWAVSAAIVAALPGPVWLAGGLHPSNVVAAIARVRPFGVDLCSGVRRDGRLVPDTARAFVQAVTGAPDHAPLARSLLPAVSHPGAAMPTAVHDLLLGDHARLDGLFDELESAAEAGAEAQALHDLWSRFERAVRAHLAAEERTLLPRLKARHGVDVDELLADHARFRGLLDRIGLEVDLHTVRSPAVQELLGGLRAHADREDATVYRWADEEAPEEGLLASLQAALQAATSLP